MISVLYLNKKLSWIFVVLAGKIVFFIHFPIGSYHKTLSCAEDYHRLKTNIIHDHLRNIPNHWYNISIPYDVVSEKRFEILVIHKENIIDPCDHVDLPKSDKNPIKCWASGPSNIMPSFIPFKVQWFMRKRLKCEEFTTTAGTDVMWWHLYLRCSFSPGGLKVKVGF